MRLWGRLPGGHVKRSSEIHGSDKGLVVQGIDYHYGAVHALGNVSIRIEVGESVCVIGSNGAGKTTLARVCGGLYAPHAGTVVFNGEVLPARAEDAVQRGIASVLEGRHLFTEQSVATNLALGTYRERLTAEELDRRLEEVFDIFPRLRELQQRRAAALSGGEQQMVAIGRALISKPSLLILDEPSMGLAPIIARQVFDALARLSAQGISILLVEQNAELAFGLTTRGYVLQHGHVAAEGTTTALGADDRVRAAYLGVMRGPENSC